LKNNENEIAKRSLRAGYATNDLVVQSVDGLMTSTPDVPPALFPLPIPSQPSIPPTLPHNLHRVTHTPLVIDNGSSSLRFGFATSTTPQIAPNIVSKYKERKAGKQLLLFGDAVDAEGGARSQAKTPWEGDVLLNFDALVSPA
jgi:actin-related protein 5